MSNKKLRAKQKKEAKKQINDSRDAIEFFKNLAQDLDKLAVDNPDYNRLPLPDTTEFESINRLRKSLPLSNFVRK